MIPIGGLQYSIFIARIYQELSLFDLELCTFLNENGVLYLVPGNEESTSNYLHLNGWKVT